MSPTSQAVGKMDLHFAHCSIITVRSWSIGKRWKKSFFCLILIPFSLSTHLLVSVFVSHLMVSSGNLALLNYLIPRMFAMWTVRMSVPSSPTCPSCTTGWWMNRRSLRMLFLRICIYKKKLFNFLFANSCLSHAAARISPNLRLPRRDFRIDLALPKGMCAV